MRRTVLGWFLFTILAVATFGIAWLLGFITWWLINAVMLTLTDRLTDRLTIDGFGWALVGALMISFIGTIVSWVLPGV